MKLEAAPPWRSISRAGTRRSPSRAEPPASGRNSFIAGPAARFKISSVADPRALQVNGMVGQYKLDYPVLLVACCKQEVCRKPGRNSAAHGENSSSPVAVRRTPHKRRPAPALLEWLDALQI